MRSTLPLLLALFVSSACVVHVKAGAGDAKPDDSAGDPATEQGEGDSAAIAPIEAETPPPADPHAALPDCPAQPSDDVYCTEAGKLAGRWMMVDTLRVPEGAEEIFAAAPADYERQPSLRIAVEGEALYVAHVSCGSCARVMGEGFHGQLDAMSGDQLRAFVLRLGLGKDAPELGSAQQWRDYAAGAGQAALDGLLMTPASD